MNIYSWSNMVELGLVSWSVCGSDCICVIVAFHFLRQPRFGSATGCIYEAGGQTGPL